MLLHVPESFITQTQAMAKLMGSDKINSVFKDVDFIVVDKNQQEVKIKKPATEEKKETAISKEVKSEAKKDKPKIEKEETVKPDAKLKPVETEEDKITMSNTKTCPVKIVPTKKNVVQRLNIDKTNNSQTVDEPLEAFKAHLKEKDINFSNIRRIHNGLVELELINNNGQPILITVDIDDKLYSLGAYVFFIGKIKPLDEYTKRAIMLTDESINAVINGYQIDPKYYVPETVVMLSSAIDTESLHEHNTEQKKKVLDTAFKAILKMQPEINSALGNGPYRFAFVKYKSENDFIMISSRKNRVSNLSNDKLMTNKEIKIEVKDDKVNMTIK